MTASTPKASLQKSRTAMAAVEQRWPYLLAILSILLFGITVVLDSKRPMWNDELFTLYISRQPTFHDLWNALLTGADQSPLLFFTIIRIFTALAGSSPTALRLPETLGFLLMSICLFLFVRRRVPVAYGFVAFIFPSVTDAYYYAFEARAYALVMGFCGLAMLCWQTAAEGRKRPLSLAGTALFLACAINSHYYAVLLLIPFGAAELVRYYGRRRLDWPLYTAIATAVVPLVFSLPIMRASSKYSSHFWAKPSWTSLISFYENLLLPAGLALMLITLVAGLALYLRIAEDSAWGRQGPPPAHEFGLAVGFALIPVVAVCIAKFVTGAFTARYAIYAVIGLSILLSWSVARLCRGNWSVGLILAATMVGCWGVSAVRHGQQFASNQATQNQTFSFLSSASASNLALVIESPHDFFVHSHVSAGAHRGHFLYLADVALALKYTGTDSVERELEALKKYAPLDVKDYHSFTSGRREFLLYSSPDFFGWLLQDLMHSGWSVSLDSKVGDGMLYLVRRPGGLASPVRPPN